MNILAIDTTTKNANVTVRKDSELYYNEVNNEITHSEKLLPLIDLCLNKMNLKLKDIDMFLALNGPGSFTGIRIGLCTIKAFSQITNKNIFSLSSLDMLCITAFIKYNHLTRNIPLYVSALIDAKNDRVYFKTLKIWINENDKIDFLVVNDNMNIFFDDALEYIKKLNNNEFKNIVAGDNINNNIERLSYIDKNFILYNMYPTSKDMTDVYDMLNNVSCYTFDAYTLDAIYARLSQAERQKKDEK